MALDRRVLLICTYEGSMASCSHVPVDATPLVPVKAPW
jgi:hypothetical protein